VFGVPVLRRHTSCMQRGCIHTCCVSWATDVTHTGIQLALCRVTNHVTVTSTFSDRQDLLEATKDVPFIHPGPKVHCCVGCSTPQLQYQVSSITRLVSEVRLMNKTLHRSKCLLSYTLAGQPEQLRNTPHATPCLIHTPAACSNLSTPCSRTISSSQMSELRTDTAARSCCSHSTQRPPADAHRLLHMGSTQSRCPRGLQGATCRPGGVNWRGGVITCCCCCCCWGIRTCSVTYSSSCCCRWRCWCCCSSTPACRICCVQRLCHLLQHLGQETATTRTAAFSSTRQTWLLLLLLLLGRRSPLPCAAAGAPCRPCWLRWQRDLRQECVWQVLKIHDSLLTQLSAKLKDRRCCSWWGLAAAHRHCLSPPLLPLPHLHTHALSQPQRIACCCCCCCCTTSVVMLLLWLVVTVIPWGPAGGKRL
jgi:hypothetical protein